MKRHDELECGLVGAEFDMRRHRARLVIPEGECTDMEGAIRLCQRFDPEVRFIQTQHPNGFRDTAYELADGAWRAI